VHLLPGNDTAELRPAVDCGHGNTLNMPAASWDAGTLLQKLGARLFKRAAGIRVGLGMFAVVARSACIGVQRLRSSLSNRVRNIAALRVQFAVRVICAVVRTDENSSVAHFGVPTFFSQDSIILHQLVLGLRLQATSTGQHEDNGRQLSRPCSPCCCRVQ
jgi:hypothetical protein